MATMIFKGEKTPTKTHTSVGLTALAASLGLRRKRLGDAAGVAIPPLRQQPVRTSARNFGKAVAYPIKKGAGNGSKDVNHGAKSIKYPFANPA